MYQHAENLQDEYGLTHLNNSKSQEIDRPICVLKNLPFILSQEKSITELKSPEDYHLGKICFLSKQKSKKANPNGF